MRGRTFRRPLITTRDGRARGRGGRLPGDQCLTCPPVAPAHHGAARRGAAAGRSGPAARRRLGARRRGDRGPGRLRLGLGGRGRRLAHPLRAHGRGHGDRVGHRDQPRQADRHRRPCGPARGPTARHPLVRRRDRQGQRRSPGLHLPGDRQQVHGEVLQAHSRRGGALQHLGAGRRAEPRQRRRLRIRGLAVRGDLRAAVGADPRHPADLPALAARRGRHQDQDHGAVATRLDDAHGRRNGTERGADPGLPQ